MDITIPAVLANLTWLDFNPQTNCELAAKCIGEELQNDAPELSTSYALVEFARECAPVSLTNVSYEELLLWNSQLVVEKNIHVINLTEQVNELCHREFCRDLDWEGDPDLSGPGVMAAYAIQVVLTVMFTLIYLLVDGYVRFSSRKSSHTPTPTPEQPDTSRLPGLTGSRRPQLESLLRQVDRCFDVFWISSIYFSLAVSVATFVINTKTKAASHYTVFFSFLGVVFSSSAIGALAPWYRPRAGARSGGSYFYIFFVTITMVAIIVSVSSYFNRTRFQDTDSNFETFCLSPLPTYRAMINFLLFTVALAGIAWAGFLASHIGCLARSQFAGAMSTFRTIIKRAISSASFLLMCTSLGFFLRLRYESEKLVDENKDQVDDWGFGQIVAVAAWLPMFIEFISVFWVVLREFKQKRKVNEGDGGVASDTPGTDRVPQNGHEERSKNPEKVKLVTSWGTTISR